MNDTAKNLNRTLFMTQPLTNSNRNVNEISTYEYLRGTALLSEFFNDNMISRPTAGINDRTCARSVT